MSKKNDAFGEMFLGEYIRITTKRNATMDVPTEDGDVLPITASIEYEGFLVDFDEKYLYIGEKSDQVSQAVKRKEVLGVTIVEKEAPNKVDLNNKEYN